MIDLNVTADITWKHILQIASIALYIATNIFLSRGYGRHTYHVSVNDWIIVLKFQKIANFGSLMSLFRHEYLSAFFFKFSGKNCRPWMDCLFWATIEYC